MKKPEFQLAIWYWNNDHGNVVDKFLEMVADLLDWHYTGTETVIKTDKKHVVSWFNELCGRLSVLYNRGVRNAVFLDVPVYEAGLSKVQGITESRVFLNDEVNEFLRSDKFGMLDHNFYILQYNRGGEQQFLTY